MRNTKRKWKKQISKGNITMDYESWKRARRFYENNPSDNSNVSK